VWCVFTEIPLTKVDEYDIIGIINKKYRKWVDKKHYLWYSGGGAPKPPYRGVKVIAFILRNCWIWG
jgi:hypothetical protein